MDQEKLLKAVQEMLAKDKENFTKKEEKMENKKYKQNINWENNYLQEIFYDNVEVETEKALLINTTLSGLIWVNKKHCYKSKKYQFKPVFLIKVFNELTYNIETNGDPDEPASIKGSAIKW